MSQQTHQKIERLVRKLAQRIRAQRAAEGLFTGATLSAMAALIAVVLFKTTWIDEHTLVMTVGISLIAPLTLAFAGWLRPLDRIALAQRLDRSHNLHDRLSTALALGANAEPTAFEAAQISEAAAHVGRVDPAIASPITRPTDLVPLLALAGCVGLLIMLRAPSHDHDLPVPPPIEHEQVLDSATIALERDRLEAIRRELQGTDDPEAVALLAEIEELLNQVEGQEISEREFLDRLDKLEEKLDAGEMKPEETERVAQALKEAAEALEKELKEELKQEPAARELVDAMKKKDLAAASKAMEKIAEMLANKDLDDKQLARLAKVMEKLAKNINFEDPALQKFMEKNKDLIDKLSKKFDKLSDKDKQRLDRAKEELAKQEQQKKENEERESTRKLKELRRLSAKANEEAEKVLKGGNKKTEKKATEDERHKFKNEAGRNAKDASKEMEEGGEKQKKDAARDMARKQIQEMREAMQRNNAGRDKSGEKNDQKGGQMKEFLERAKGQDKTDMKGAVEQQKRAGEDAGKGTSEAEREAQGGEGQAKKDSGGTDQEAKEESDFAGRGKGSRELGEETKLDGKRVDQKVDATAGKGPSRSEIIKSASEEGFATTEYKDVYVDYSSVVEEVMEKENIPAGYRYYIKRYFQLIKPQE